MFWIPHVMKGLEGLVLLNLHKTVLPEKHCSCSILYLNYAVQPPTQCFLAL